MSRGISRMGLHSAGDNGMSSFTSSKPAILCLSLPYTTGILECVEPRIACIVLSSSVSSVDSANTSGCITSPTANYPSIRQPDMILTSSSLSIVDSTPSTIPGTYPAADSDFERDPIAALAPAVACLPIETSRTGIPPPLLPSALPVASSSSSLPGPKGW